MTATPNNEAAGDRLANWQQHYSISPQAMEALRNLLAVTAEQGQEQAEQKQAIWEEWLDGDTNFMRLPDSAVRYEVSFVIREGHHGVWRAYFNPDTEREPQRETHLGTFASIGEAQKACEDHRERVGRYADNDGGVPYVY